MFLYIVKRILLLIPTLIGVTILIFTLLYFAEGDPARNLLGNEATEAEVMRLRAEWKLDEPYLVRYFDYMGNLLLRGSFGFSYITKKDVSKEIINRFPVTVTLALQATALAIVFGVAMGIIAAVNQNSFFDNFTMFLALVGASMPGFWIGLVLSIVFALNLRWFPPSGWGTFAHTIMPTVSLAVAGAAQLARQTRSSMLEVIRQDYIVTAKSKGLSNFKVIYVHALRNALIPVVTVAGFIFSWLVGGAVVTETVFQVPGLGTYMVNAINARDYPVIQGSVLYIAFVFAIVILLVDILYASIDPRIRAKYKKG